MLKKTENAKENWTILPKSEQAAEEWRRLKKTELNLITILQNTKSLAKNQTKIEKHKNAKSPKMFENPTTKKIEIKKKSAKISIIMWKFSIIMQKFQKTCNN